MPRTPLNLFDDISAFDNLLRAWRLARRAGRTAPGAAAFHYQLENEVVGLRAGLRRGAYRPEGYHSFVVTEPKRRLVSAAPFHDRVVHHALVGVLEPLFERRFVFDSYACRKGKGTHAAVARAHRFTRRFRWCLRADVRRFFPSVDHEVLLETVRRVVRCRRTLALVATILDHGKDVLKAEAPKTLFPGDDLLALLRPKGLPIGNLTSQFLANVFLDPVDHFVKEDLRIRGYVRYADDFRIFHDDKEALRAVRLPFEKCLEDRRLLLHAGKTQIAPCTDGVPFLGFRLFPDGRRRLLGASVRRFRRRSKRLVDEVAAGHTTPAAARASVRSWLSHAEHANTNRLRRQILEEIRTRWNDRQRRPRSSSAPTTSSSGSSRRRRSSPGPGGTP